MTETQSVTCLIIFFAKSSVISSPIRILDDQFIAVDQSMQLNDQKDGKGKCFINFEK